MEKETKKCVHKYVYAGSFDRNYNNMQSQINGYTNKIVITFCEKCADIQSKTI